MRKAVGRSRCIAAQNCELQDVHRFFVGSAFIADNAENEVSRSSLLAPFDNSDPVNAPQKKLFACLRVRGLISQLI